MLFLGSIFDPLQSSHRKHFGSHSGTLFDHFGHLFLDLFWDPFWGSLFNYFLDPPNCQNLNSVWDVLRFLACGGKGLVTPNYKKKEPKQSPNTADCDKKRDKKTALKIKTTFIQQRPKTECQIGSKNPRDELQKRPSRPQNALNTCSNLKSKNKPKRASWAPTPVLASLA